MRLMPRRRRSNPCIPKSPRWVGAKHLMMSCKIAAVVMSFLAAIFPPKPKPNALRFVGTEAQINYWKSINCIYYIQYIYIYYVILIEKKHWKNMQQSCHGVLFNASSSGDHDLAKSRANFKTANFSPTSAMHLSMVSTRRFGVSMFAKMVSDPHEKPVA